MLKSLSIKSFRLFRELHINSLNRINLITGENDTGKTALLEALCLLFGDARSFLRLPLALRSSFDEDSAPGRHRPFPDEYESFWLWLINKKNLQSSIEVKASGNDGGYSVRLVVSDLESLKNYLHFDYSKDNESVAGSVVSRNEGGARAPKRADWPTVSVFSTIPSSPTEDADYFNRIAAKRSGEKKLIELLRVVEPQLQDLKYLKLGSQALVYADVGMEDLIPTTQLGQAFTRLLRLFSEILVAGSKIVLIDEIENGIHYSAMPKVWKGIAAMARQEDLQIFATTHSYECIRFAHQAFSSEPVYDLALHRLERDDSGNVRAITLDRESLATSFDLEWEIR